MASLKPCMAQLSKLCLSSTRTLRPHSPAAFLLPAIQVRHAGGAGANPQKGKKKNEPTKKRKERKHYIQYDLKDADQFSLCDAMR